MNYFTRQGKSIPDNVREVIVEKWLSGNVPTEIGKELRLSRQTVSNIVDNYICKGVHAAGKGGNHTRLGRTDDVINYVEYCKTIKPSSFGAEIQNTLEATLVIHTKSLALFLVNHKYHKQKKSLHSI